MPDNPLAPILAAIAAILLAVALVIRQVVQSRDKKADPDDAVAQRIEGYLDQMRRDLQSTIETAHARTDKQNADAMQRLLLELEIFVKGALERRRGPR